MEIIKASVGWPTKKIKRSFEWACSWPYYACFHHLLTSENQPPLNLKLLTPPQAANVAALRRAMLWLSAAGVGPAFLATMLVWGRGRRVRRALACVGLASAVADHCLLAWLLGVDIVTGTNDDGLFTIVVAGAMLVFVFLAVGDVNAALVLLDPSSCWTWRGGEGDEPGKPPAGDEAEQEY